MKGSGFVFDYVHYCILSVLKNLRCGGSYLDSSEWIKTDKATISPINKNENKCFQYAVTVALSYEEIKNDRQRITKIKPFMNKYNWEGINFPLEKYDLKKIREK